jgi:hypothetical protein
VSQMTGATKYSKFGESILYILDRMGWHQTVVEGLLSSLSAGGFVAMVLQIFTLYRSIL